jgi:hypothetical protein
MSELFKKPNKILPVMLAGFLTYKIYVCPCGTYMKCNPILRWLLPMSLLFFVYIDYPLI